MSGKVTARVLADPPIGSLGDHLAAGGGRGLRHALEEGGDAVIDEIARAGLRGRGGAGFPTATKWRSVAGSGERCFVVCNAAEGEPGTFKDRAIIRSNPYQVVEGLLIAAHTVGAEAAYLALKASFATERALIDSALRDAEAAGWLGDISVTIATGPEEYLFGEEKALLEVIEGNDPLPRWLPPYLHGLFATDAQLGWESTAGVDDDPAPGANPTLVNNAETLAQVAWICAHGVDAFRSVGTEQSPGTVVCTVVGDVERPSVVEVPMGTPLIDVIEPCGLRPDRIVKAVFSGVANAVLPGNAVATPLTYEALDAAGAGLGAAGFIVYDDSACMVEVAATLSRFLSVESCGQCPPCKLGSGAITGSLERIRDGGGTDADLDRIRERLRIVTDGNRCYLPVQERAVVSSLLRTFPADFALHLAGRCPSMRLDYPIPKIVDLADGQVVYDERQRHKQPDWTYRT